nr:hypothetical protein [uncultured Agathobaculum sp.]
MGLLSSVTSALSGAAGSISGAANKLTFATLKKTYMEFESPQAAIFFAGSAFQNNNNYVIDEIHVEVTSDFEASVASFRIYNVYDQSAASFRYSDIKKQVCIGNTLDIVLGYLGVGQTVFHGFVAGLDFHYDAGGLPYIEVTGMDIKGIMMASRYSQQIAAASYSAAVEQIFARSVYSSLMQDMSLKVVATPDGGPAGGLAGGLGGNLMGGLSGAQSTSATTIEMVSESDYEFVVKAAKRFNYEFFADKNTIYFRPAKADTNAQAELAVGAGILEFNVGYSVSGLVGEVETRSVDAGTGKLVKASKKLSQDTGIESKARVLVSKAQKVYIDASIQSQQDADARADSLFEKMRYRLGSFEATCIGIPDLSPGRFLDVKGMGAPADNSFYITTVTHQFSSMDGYKTRLVGKTAKYGASLSGVSSIASGLGGLL